MNAQELKFVENTSVELQDYLPAEIDYFRSLIEKYFSTYLEKEVSIKITTLEDLLVEYDSFTLEQIAVMLCNLEDTECMQEILDDNFEDSFDPWNESIFNDSYWDMSEALNLHGESERNEEDED